MESELYTVSLYIKGKYPRVTKAEIKDFRLCIEFLVIENDMDKWVDSYSNLENELNSLGINYVIKVVNEP